MALNSTTPAASKGSISTENGFIHCAEFDLRATRWFTDAQDCATTLIVPPLDEEMHIARRHMAAWARALAAAGQQVVLYDHPGTGESVTSSPPSFDQVVQALHALLDLLGPTHSLSVISVRSGFLPVAALSLPASLARHIACEPVRSGQEYLQLLLRQQTLAVKLRKRTDGPGENLEAALQNGQTVHIAGRRMTSEYFFQLRNVSFEALDVGFAHAQHALFLSEAGTARLGPAWPMQNTVVSSDRFWIAENAGSQDIENKLVQLYAEN